MFLVTAMAKWLRQSLSWHREYSDVAIGNYDDIIWWMVCTVGHCNGSAGHYDNTNLVVLCHKKILWCQNSALV